MKCDVCGNTATVFLTQIVDDKMSQVNFCDKCAKEKGVTKGAGFKLADDLLAGGAQRRTEIVPKENGELLPPGDASFARVILCWALGIVAVLSLWHIPDLWAAAIYGLGTAIYYLPRKAAADWVPPRWVRIIWFAVVSVVAAAFLFFDSPAPGNSVISPAAKYGLLAIVVTQACFELIRRKQSRVVR